MIRILIADDEESFRRILSLQARRLGFQIIEAEDGLQAWNIVKESGEPIDVIVTDLKMPEMDGLELLQKLRRDFPQIPVIMITAHGTIDTAVEAMKRGAFDYITKPFNVEEFSNTLKRAVDAAAISSREFHRSRAFLRKEEKIIGSTDEMERIYSIIEKVANSNSPVLITGETGTGKDIVARLLHDKSEHRQLPLVMASMSTCPPLQQHHALFGTSEKPGWIQLAEGGSLYLDEIGTMTLDVQAELYHRIMNARLEKGPLTLNCRIIAASDFNLLEKIDIGSFRKDLFYALNVVPIYLPPLRERTQDIEPLVDHFISVFSKKYHKEIKRIDDEALHLLIQYPWPGNIRELENCIEYAANLCDNDVIFREHLPSHLFSTPLMPSKSWDGSSKDRLIEKVARLEKGVIEDAIRSSNGDILKASQKLGIPPSLLQDRISQLKISTSH